MSQKSIEEQIVEVEERMDAIRHTLDNQGNYNLDAETINELNEEFAELEAEVKGMRFFQALDNKGVDGDTDECVACQG